MYKRPFSPFQRGLFLQDHFVKVLHMLELMSLNAFPFFVNTDLAFQLNDGKFEYNKRCGYGIKLYCVYGCGHLDQ